MEVPSGERLGGNGRLNCDPYLSALKWFNHATARRYTSALLFMLLPNLFFFTFLLAIFPRPLKGSQPSFLRGAFLHIKACFLYVSTTFAGLSVTTFGGE